MRILIHIDETPATKTALVVGARLALNLWPQLTLLAVTPKPQGDGTAEIENALDLLTLARWDFLEICGPQAPYTAPESPAQVVRVNQDLVDYGPGETTGKNVSLRLRFGETAEAILAQADAEEADLIIMGGNSSGATGDQSYLVPLTVASQSSCSTLIIKDTTQVENIIVGVENPNLDQTAREMFNQMATIFKAPAAMYPLPSPQGQAQDLSVAMDRLVKIFSAHDLGVVSAGHESLGRTISELYDKAHNLLVLR